ncbi:MAG: branched-chain amino acid ABC transporter permease [Candidatus Rokubacteria bacterium]|nr:branched-chain amino acid ABC transporter permease [Candidatus Rokubacteria bacterium]
MRGWRTLGILMGAAVLLLLPLLLEQYKLYLASLTLVYLILAIGLNLTLGYAGQISLAHAGFMSFGAYAVAILGPLGVPFEAGLIVGAIIAFFWGLVLGFPALKVKHHYLAMVTLGFNIIVFLVLRNWESLTGGSFGISGIARPRWGPIGFQSDRAYYYYILGWAVLVVASAHWILHSRWGRAFRAIRENEVRAQVVGVSLRTYKLMAFAIGSAYAGVGGALFAPLLAYIDPGAFTLDRSIQFLLMVVMGGLGRFEGPFIGAAVVTLLPEALRASEGFYLIIFSLAVILMMLFMPKGLVGVWDWMVGRATRRGFGSPRPPAPREPATVVAPK